MKKIVAITTLIVLVWGCDKKMAPAKTATTATVPVAAPVEETPKSTIIANTVAGKETFTAKCGRCHGLKDPANYTAERWVGLIDWMGPKARLDETEKKNVLAYVQAGAKRV